MEDLIGRVQFTSFSSGDVLVTLLLVLVLQHLDDAQADFQTQRFDQHRNGLGQFFLGLAVVQLDGLLFRVLFGQGLARGHEAQIIDDGEARQGNLLGLVVFVEEEVLALLVGDPEGLTVFATVSEREDQGYRLSTARRFTGVQGFDLAGVDVGFFRLVATTEAILGLFQTVGFQIAKQAHVFLSLSENGGEKTAT